MFTGELNKETWNYINKQRPKEIEMAIGKFYDEFKFIEPIHIKEHAPNIFNANITVLTLCNAWKSVGTVEKFTTDDLPADSGCKEIPKSTI